MPSRLRRVLSPGSFPALSTGTTDDLTPAQIQKIEDVYSKATAPAVIRSRAEIERLFIGFELIEPGLVHVARWRAEGPETAGRRRPQELSGAPYERFMPGPAIG